MNTPSSKIARTIITIAAIVTIIVPSVMDLNSTHMTNPLWAPHARFHWSIQWMSITQLNVIALYLLWGKYDERSSKLSVVLAVIAPVLFWGNFFPSMLMPGTSTWPDGVQPFAPVAPNVFIAGVITSACLYAMYADARSRRKKARNGIVK